MAISGMALTAGFSGVAAHSAYAFAWLQTQEAIPAGDTRLLTIFVAMTALALLVAAVALAVIAFVTVKLRAEIMGHVNDIKARALPIMDKFNVLIADLTPQVKAITLKVSEIAASVEKITALAKDKAEEFSPAVSAAKETFLEANTTARDVNQKTRAQVERVNGMISATLDATSKIGAKIHHGINVPAREIAGVVSGVKAGVDTFMSGMRSYGRGPRPAASAPVHPVSQVPFSRASAETAASRDVSSGMPLTADKHDLGL